MPQQSIPELMAAPSIGVLPVRRAWHRRSSSFTRYGFLAYMLLLIDATLYPWSGWRDRGIGPFDFLFAPWPSYYTGFDLSVNVLGYIPVGMLAVLAFYPRLRGFSAVIVATLLGATLSCGLEAIQTFLPSRVASRLDLITNLAGVILGALLAMRFAEAILDRGRLRQFRMRWFERDASVALVVVSLWFFALLYPDTFAFAPGGLLKPLFDLLVDESELQSGLRFDPVHATAWQAAIATLAITGAGAMFLAQMRRFAPRIGLIVVFVLLSMLAQTLSIGMTSQAVVFGWLTLGTQWGIAVALFTLILIAYLPTVWRARCAFAALAAAVVMAAILPHNPYFGSGYRPWAYGQYLNFFGLTLGLHLCWPILALAVLFRKLWQRKSNVRTL